MIICLSPAPHRGQRGGHAKAISDWMKSHPGQDVILLVPVRLLSGAASPARMRGAARRDAMTFLRPIWRVVLACAALLAPTGAMADAVADFYHGKTINLYVSFPPGGGYDIYARILVLYFSRHIPGNPAVVIKNMEGGSGVK